MRKKIVYPLTASSGGLTSITASNVDSESATSGQVLTANGNGGATWETPASGGGSLYSHFVKVINYTTHRMLFFTIYNNLSSMDANAVKDYMKTLTRERAYFSADGLTTDANGNITGHIVAVGYGVSSGNDSFYHEYLSTSQTNKPELMSSSDYLRFDQVNIYVTSIQLL